MGAFCATVDNGPFKPSQEGKEDKDKAGQTRLSNVVKCQEYIIFTTLGAYEGKPGSTTSSLWDGASPFRPHHAMEPRWPQL
ncbi:hypothetical protein CBS147343_3468 [Aspergillus niger]|nr:hypothetical protein CBS133816_9640 [Aspergillus niger]KAI2842738.1 hypothetical protein CBS11350_5706 [Aspergillus niger]KAI2908824.1 hypothetical protein CBS147371_9723 [Aspergillus niger]KAI2920087.1 hypothetical protein CBS147320_8353 [Aspergillus niger]KAI2933311.1 hypothetical protein CBS147321_9682 [Aspergillus niger]